VEFLFSRNRLNVAIARSCWRRWSRAQLLEIRSRTIEQMRMVNALCVLCEKRRPSARRQRDRSKRVCVT
jgi:hypothetical protein